MKCSKGGDTSLRDNSKEIQKSLSWHYAKLYSTMFYAYAYIPHRILCCSLQQYASLTDLQNLVEALLMLNREEQIYSIKSGTIIVKFNEQRAMLK